MQQLKAVIDRELAAGFFPGCVVAWGRGEALQGICSRGLAQRASPAREMLDDSVFDVASLTKVVATATALGCAMESGKLSLDTQVVDVLGAPLEALPSALTLRHVVTHSSGFDNAKPAPGLRGDAALADWLSVPAAAPPGTQFVYACKNAVLGSLIVEATTGIPFAVYCQDRVFAPLGMIDTCFGPLEPSERMVSCGAKELGQISDEPACAIGRPIGNAGVFSTARDLSRFARMMLNGGELDGVRVLEPTTVRLLTSVQAPPGLPEFGVYWNMDQAPDPYHSRPGSCSSSTYGHGGYTGQSLWIDPSHGDFVVVLSNRLCAKGLQEAPDRYTFLTEANLARVRIGEAVFAEMRVQTG
ncbi:MAG: beta-lactamase family protein [Lentisphaerae bacterium]|nr:beta-lactamase family protein [Lentisphaerota bacterium]MBT4814062.1 beta-lactamase family protein [Lentisphaerota bacterium]MBT5608375.1 beta-lactamase family protein [Lentisphaerota bacterium]MBT7060992.1 beta-lactamase family protein [Lentisphaerota bacterium]MBT7848359.1 beta-lactamase family protein [Lentisphaerota bacterium]